MPPANRRTRTQRAELPPGHRAPGNRVQLACGRHLEDGSVLSNVGCGQVDDHPKHIVAEADGSTTVQHLDCCNCTSCVIHLDHAGEKRGLDLATHIQTHGDAIAEAVAATESQED